MADYAFRRKESVAKSLTKTFVLPRSRGLKWFTTRELAPCAKRHCATIATANIALYLASSKQSLELAKRRLPFLLQVLEKVGNGPVLFLGRKSTRVLEQLEIKERPRLIWDFKQVLRALEEEKILALLLCKNLLNWHWVLAVGYGLGPQDELYLELVTGWQEETYYYLPGQGSLFVAALVYE